MSSKAWQARPSKRQTVKIRPPTRLALQTRRDTFPFLTNSGGDKILQAESPAKWQVDPLRFLEITEY
jgi:hypothetical protein